ncbi:MAG: hypothetical protein [Bacteriophage sp.]|nr:MAG: hypothetical protein [Bacteriophage sp.]
MTIKGYVELSKENGMQLITECKKVISALEPDVTIVRQFSFKKMKYVNIKQFRYPFFHQYKDALIDFFESLEYMLDLPDKVNLSLVSYENLVLLSKGDRRANPIFIMNY